MGVIKIYIFSQNKRGLFFGTTQTVVKKLHQNTSRRTSNSDSVIKNGYRKTADMSRLYILWKHFINYILYILYKYFGKQRLQLEVGYKSRRGVCVKNT